MSVPVEQMVADYLRVRRSLGYELAGTEYILNRFVAYLYEHDADGVTVEHALAFATTRPGASRRWQALRLSAVRCFARWAHCLDPSIEVPPARLLPARPTRVAPYIYPAQEIQALLQAASGLRHPLRAATFPAVIGLMATTGIRTGEAVGLDTTSLDTASGALTVRGKYGKVRMLPLHPTAVEALTDYLTQRNRMLLTAKCPALFISTRGTRLRATSVQQTFRNCANRRVWGQCRRLAIPGHTTCVIPSRSTACWTHTAPRPTRPRCCRCYRPGWGTPSPQTPTGT